VNSRGIFLLEFLLSCICFHICFQVSSFLCLVLLFLSYLSVLNWFILSLFLAFIGFFFFLFDSSYSYSCLRLFAWLFPYLTMAFFLLQSIALHFNKTLFFQFIIFFLSSLFLPLILILSVPIILTHELSFQ